MKPTAAVLICIGLLASGTNGLAAPQQWEYCIVEVQWTLGEIDVYAPNGSKYTHKGKPGNYEDLTPILTSLGTRGWEVATCAGHQGMFIWTLKRNKTEQTKSSGGNRRVKAKR